MRDRFHFVLTCWLAIALVAPAAGPARELSANDLLSRYYEGLRDRGLYRLAESDCLRRLADPGLSHEARAHLSIELSQFYAAHAAQTGGPEQEELWRRATQTVDALLDEGAAESYRELLAAQSASVDAARGAQLRWQVELFPLDDRLRERAAEILRSALAKLEPLPVALDERVRIALDAKGRSSARKESPSPSRYRDVRREVEFQIAAANVDLANVLPVGPDRIETLHRAEVALKELADTPKPDDAAWLAEVMLIEVVRLRGVWERVAPRVTTLIKKSPPPAIRDAAVAQWVRADLDAKRPDDALERLQKHRREYGTDSGELTCLLVETLLAARRLAFDKQQPDLANDLLTQAAAFATELSGAWGTRSKLLIDAAHEADTYGPELADDVRRAKWAWRNGNLDDAISAYFQAVATAHQAGKSEFAVELAITMASLQLEARRYEGAIVTLTGLLDNYPDSARAADAHLLRTYALGRQYEQQPNDEHLTAYRSALEEHRSTFAGSATEAEATWMLARLEEHQQNWQAAMTLLEAIPADSKHAAAAQARLAAVYEQFLAEREQQGEPTDELRLQAIAALTSATESFPSAPEPLTEPQAELAWRLAKMLLNQAEPDFAAADQLLERVLQTGNVTDASADDAADDAAIATDPADSTRMAAASQLRIISLAGQGRLEEARTFAARWEASEPDRLLDVLSGLSTAATQVALEHKRTVGTIQLELSQRLAQQRDRLTESQRLKLDESLAQAHAALGQIPQAAAVYEKIIWQRPNDTRVIESLARLYESCGTLSCIRNASRQWEALERLQRKGSNDWLETRFHMAWCSHRLGDHETAHKLIAVTRVLYPELGTPPLKERFDQLASAISAAM